MKNFLKILTIILTTQVVFASGGSVYSRFGLGDVVYNFSTRRFGMGNLGLAVIDRNFVSGVNPASWSGINLTRLEAAISFVGNNISDANSSFNRRATYFNGVSFAVPIQRDYGIVASFGVLPFSKVNYNVTESFKSTMVGDYSEELKGDGGVSKLFIGATYKIPFGFSLGATLEYYFGKIEYYSNLIFPDTSSFRSVGYVQRKSYMGFGATFGIISPDLNKNLGLKNFENIRVGILFSPGSKINTDTTISTNNLVGGNTIANGLTKTEIPMRFGSGISFVFNQNYLVVADYLQQNWSNYKFANESEKYLSSAFKISFGIEHFNRTTPFSPFWEQVRYRFGLSYQKTPYRILGKDIYQYDISAGISFPMGVGNSIDLGVLAGMRGKKEGSLLKEKFVEARISLSFGERWFIRRNR